MHQLLGLKKIARALVACAIPVVASLGTACSADAPSSDTGSLQIIATARSALSFGEVTALIVTLNGPVGAPPVGPLALTPAGGRYWQTPGPIALHTGTWTFQGDAYTDCTDVFTCAGHTPVYSTTYPSGSAPPTDTVAAGSTGTVVLNLQEVNGDAGHDFTNTTPRVTSLTVSAGAGATSILTNETIALAVTVSDPDADPLTYQWTDSPAAGTFSAPTSTTTNWTAPPTEGDYTISMLADDGHGGQAGISVVIHVGDFGTRTLSAVVNTWPVFDSTHGVTSSATLPLTTTIPGRDSTVLSTNVVDPDNDYVHVHWDVLGPCTGTFNVPDYDIPSGYTGPYPTFTLAADIGDTSCTLQATVCDLDPSTGAKWVDGAGNPVNSCNVGTIAVQIGTNTGANPDAEP